MSNASYPIGTQITLQGTFKDIAGNLIDPTTVTCVVRTPDREEVSPSVTHASLGVYTANFTPSIIGGHSYKFQGTGNCQVAAFNNFQATGIF